MVEEEYLPTVPVPVHSMDIFYNSAAEPDRELLKLSVRANFEAMHIAQANPARRRQWRKGIGAAALEWVKIQGRIPKFRYMKCTYLTPRRSQEHLQASCEPW